MPSSLLTWDTARAAGFAAYLLVTASVAIGLVLSLRWRGGLWTRFVTTELHRFVTLLSLVFVAVHGLAVLIDPFIRFTPAEVLVPLASHYRPIWMALGIVSGYLLVAVWLSERIQRRIGYAWWRRLHYVTFVTFLLVTVHGIATGSDTRTGWGLLVYGGSTTLVGVLLAVRLFIPGPRAEVRGAAAALSGALVAAVVLFTAAGPLRPGWSVAAGGDVPGAAPSQAVAGLTSTANDPGAAAGRSGGAATSGPLQPVSGRFSASYDATNATVTGPLPGGGTLRLLLAGGDDGQDGMEISGAQVLLAEQGGPVCSGNLQATRGALVGTCSTPDGRTLHVQVGLRETEDGRIRGTIAASPN